MIIGIAQQGLSFADAAHSYTILTVGDGLVTQVPALIVSTAAGLLVSKAGVSGAADKKLRKKPAPDKWSVAEILAHLADVEIVIGWRMRSILGAPGIEVQAYDQNAWNASLHYDKRDPRKDLIQQRVNREANLALLKTLTPGQWKQFGMHSERGQESLEHIVKMVAGHDLNHIQQIERTLEPKKK